MPQLVRASAYVDIVKHGTANQNGVIELKNLGQGYFHLGVLFRVAEWDDSGSDGWSLSE
jgi:hypothetical protein